MRHCLVTFFITSLPIPSWHSCLSNVLLHIKCVLFFSPHICNTTNKLLDQWKDKFCVECFRCIFRQINNNLYQFPQFINSMQSAFLKHLLISQTTNIIVLLYCSHYVMAELGNVSLNKICNFSPFQKKNPIFKF
jgi:hypothetical protein